MHYRIFIPCERALPEASSKQLESVGLDYIAKGFNAKFGRVGDRPGMIYHWPSTADATIEVDGIEWEPALEFDGLPEGRYQIGFVKDNLPRSMQLQLPMRIPGRHQSLGLFGDAWLLPEVLRFPVTMIWSGKGLKNKRINRYNELVISKEWIQESEEFLAQIREGRADDSIPLERWWRFCLHSLQINYRVTPEVANKLELITSDKASKIILSALGAISAHDAEQEAALGE